jgi:hypothetical protein
MQRLIYSNQHDRFEPTVHSVTGSPTTTNHWPALVTAVLNSYGNTGKCNRIKRNTGKCNTGKCNTG